MPSFSLPTNLIALTQISFSLENGNLETCSREKDVAPSTDFTLSSYLKLPVFFIPYLLDYRIVHLSSQAFNFAQLKVYMA